MAHLEVLYSRENNKHIITTNNKSLGNIIIDTNGVPAEERNGTAKELLCASSLYCYCSALASAMEARGLSYKDIKAKAILLAGNNDKNLSRVLSVRLDVEVSIDEDDLDMFERIQKVMRNGCLVTNSLHDGIELTYNLNANYEEE